MTQTLLIVLVVLVALLAAGVLVLVLRRPGDDGSAARLEQRLLDQERAINAQLGDVLGKVGHALQQTSERTAVSLQESTKATQVTLQKLGERLAVMDKAQENITQLSTQMVGLQDILSNKQARGAFGEVQLADLVSGILPPRTYAFQETLGNGKRADCLIRLPNPPGPICIDSKFPLESIDC